MAKKITKANAQRIQSLFMQWNWAQQDLRKYRPLQTDEAKQRVSEALESSKAAWNALFDEFGIAITREND